MPRLLYCGHTVCHSCLLRIAPSQDVICCPFDRQPTPVGRSTHLARYLSRIACNSMQSYNFRYFWSVGLEEEFRPSRTSRTVATMLRERNVFVLPLRRSSGEGTQRKLLLPDSLLVHFAPYLLRFGLGSSRFDAMKMMSTLPSYIVRFVRLICAKNVRTRLTRRVR